MMFLAILGLILTIAAAIIAFGVMMVGVDEGSTLGTLLPIPLLIALIALAIWQPVYWLTGVA